MQESALNLSELTAELAKQGGQREEDGQEDDRPEDPETAPEEPLSSLCGGIGTHDRSSAPGTAPGVGSEKLGADGTRVHRRPRSREDALSSHAMLKRVSTSRHLRAIAVFLSVPFLLTGIPTTVAATAGEEGGRFPFRHHKQALERPLRLLLVSDSHDSLEFVPRIRTLSERLQVDAVIHSGDLQQFGTANEWRAVSEAWSRWPRPLLVTSGNHDHRQDSFTRLQQRFGPLPRCETFGGLRVVLLDDGAYRLGSQLNWLDRTLSRDPGRRTLVVLHVPLRVAPDLRWLGTLDWLPLGTLMRVMKQDHEKREDHLSLPVGEREALATVLARHRVDAVLSGHLHMRARDLESPGAPTLALGAAGSFIPGAGYGHEVVLATVGDRGMQILPIGLDDRLHDPLALVKGWRQYVRQARHLADGGPP